MNLWDILPNLLDNRQIKQISVLGNISFISNRAIMHDIFEKTWVITACNILIFSSTTILCSDEKWNFREQTKLVLNMEGWVKSSVFRWIVALLWFFEAFSSYFCDCKVFEQIQLARAESQFSNFPTSADLVCNIIQNNCLLVIIISWHH